MGVPVPAAAPCDEHPRGPQGCSNPDPRHRVRSRGVVPDPLGECLHPELLHDHAAAGPAHHPDRHRREGFTIAELEGLGDLTGMRMQRAYTYRIPIPDRVMGLTPRRLSRRIASLGTRRLPLGLQLYAEFMRP